MSISPLSEEYFVVVTSTNKIYYITFNDVCFYCTDDNVNYKSLTSDYYNKFHYNEIISPGKISNVNSKTFEDCEPWEKILF